MKDIVERLRDKWQHSEDDCYEAADEIKQLREELYEIKLAAAGGEDAPGAANMVRAKDVERWTKELWLRVRDGETEIERLREALRPDNKLIGDIAHILTGLCNSLCCRKTGGYLEANCECRDVATEIAELYTARAALGEGKE